MRCPFCDSPDVEVVSAWGGQLMTSQMRCRACNSHFEAVRDDFAAADEGGEAAGGRAP
jgi:transcriptional regulator NrdR family protein